VETKRKNGEIVVGNNCMVKNTVFNFYGEGGKIVIKNHVNINARPEAKTRLFVKDNSSIVIDDDCLLSNTIDISTTDWHSVVDEKGERLNLERDVYIGKHVWIGRKVIIGKGVSIGKNSVIGAGSVVTKPFVECNVIIAGNPAKVRKSNVNWKL
jgi:acetyltransferase-like isoleucine patch superfamily enzyme